MATSPKISQTTFLFSLCPDPPPLEQWEGEGVEVVEGHPLLYKQTPPHYTQLSLPLKPTSSLVSNLPLSSTLLPFPLPLPLSPNIQTQSKHSSRMNWLKSMLIIIISRVLTGLFLCLQSSTFLSPPQKKKVIWL